MGLLIYDAPDPARGFSEGDFSDPLVQAFDGITGNIVNRRYYVRNDNNTRSFSSIILQPVFDSGDNIIDGTNGFNWKLIVGDTQPLEAQWDLVGVANSISIPDIGTGILTDIATYEPFWLRITVPQGAPVKSHSGIKMRLTGTETIVP